jgi:hypothetical protein
MSLDFGEHAFDGGGNRALSEENPFKRLIALFENAAGRLAQESGVRLLVHSCEQ